MGNLFYLSGRKLIKKQNEDTYNDES